MTRNHLKIPKTKRSVVNLSCVIKPVKAITIWEESVERIGFTHLEQYWLFLSAEEILSTFTVTGNDVAQENLLSFTGSIAIADVKHECTLIVNVNFSLIAHSC